jgi:hypothetical protein
MSVIGVYCLVLSVVAVFALILIIIAFIVGSPVFTGIAFVLALSLILIAWLPAGLILKLFSVNSAVLPAPLKAFVAWVAFVGFMGMVFPDLLAFKTLIGATLVALIFLGIAIKINAMDKIIYPLLLVMCLTLIWQHFFPEDFRSSVRYAQSWSKRVNTLKDRGSIDNETDAATTYAQVLKDVDVLYLPSAASLDADTSNHLKRGDIVRLVNNKDEVTIYDGQGFVEIQLMNVQGTYFKGPKYWIEAELVQIAAPREIIPEDKSLLSVNTETEMVETISSDIIYLTPGVYNYFMSTGEISKEFHLTTGHFCINTSNNDQAILLYDNSVTLNLWELSKLPSNNEFKIRSLVTQTVTIKVF